MSRPELTGHASQFYNAKEARKYDSSSRMVGIQREITQRAVELLRLNGGDGDGADNNTPCYILDIGCGSGLSGQILSEHGHVWIGCDISRDMLLVAKERMEFQNPGDDDDDDDKDERVESQPQPQPQQGDLIHHDMGTGLPFRPASFDACISISALQWLCYSNTASQVPVRRLTRFFSSLYSVLKRGGRAVLQFYPETAEQAVLISETATKVGFTGGVVVDYPNSAKAKKHYLVLGFDRNHHSKKACPRPQVQAQAATTTTTTTKVPVMQCHGSKKKQGATPPPPPPPKKKRGGTKTKEWILHKKQVARQKGLEVRPDSKFTGRKRPTKF